MTARCCSVVPMRQGLSFWFKLSPKVITWSKKNRRRRGRKQEKKWRNTKMLGRRKRRKTGEKRKGKKEKMKKWEEKNVNRRKKQQTGEKIRFSSSVKSCRGTVEPTVWRRLSQVRVLQPVEQAVVAKPVRSELYVSRGNRPRLSVCGLFWRPTTIKLYLQAKAKLDLQK